MACLICGPKVDTRHSSNLRKNVYKGHRQHLDRHHPYQRDCIAFNGQPKHISPPTRVCAVEFMRRVEECEEWLSRRTQAKIVNMTLYMFMVSSGRVFFFNYHIGWQVCPLPINALVSHNSNDMDSLFTWNLVKLMSPWLKVLKFLVHVC